MLWVGSVVGLGVLGRGWSPGLSGFSTGGFLGRGRSRGVHGQVRMIVVHSCCQLVAQGQRVGRCRRIWRAEVAIRAGVWMSWARMVAVSARAYRSPAVMPPLRMALRDGQLLAWVDVAPPCDAVFEQGMDLKTWEAVGENFVLRGGSTRFPPIPFTRLSQATFFRLRCR